MRLYHTPKNAYMYQMISDNSQEIIICFDRKGRIVYYNLMAASELGYGQEIYQLAIYDVFKNAFSYTDHTFSVLTERNKTEETVAYRKNMTCFSVELKISVFENGKTYIGICMARNISEVKMIYQRNEQLIAELEKVKDSKKNIATNVTHELRTPVNGILGLSNNLLDTELDSNQREIVQLIRRCCNNMEAIINDLLDYAKLNNEKMVLEHREFNFRTFINNIIDFNRPRISEKGLKLLAYLSDEIPDIVVGDELRLTQIVNNLLSNSMKFTIIGQIALEVVKLSQTGQTVELFFMIIDTGIGISKDDKDKLFQSFSQVDSSITRRFGGTGLGLAISKKLVEAMGGTIGVDSEPGKGSRFSFSVRLGLPVQNEERENPKNQFAGQATSEPLYRETVHDEGYTSEISDIGYIDKLLKEAGNASKGIGPDISTNNNSVIKQLKSVIEKLSICIEMENWDMAEDLAYKIKKTIPVQESEITKLVFRLLLTVRKENHDLSMEIIHELESFINER